jgi:hypothetical protein
MSKKAPCPCGKKTIPGLISSVSLCQEHYNALMFGTGEAHKEAVIMLRRSQQAATQPRLRALHTRINGVTKKEVTEI